MTQTKRKRAIGGWTRIGIVASVLWMIVGGAWGWVSAPSYRLVPVDYDPYAAFSSPVNAPPPKASNALTFDDIPSAASAPVAGPWTDYAAPAPKATPPGHKDVRAPDGSIVEFPDGMSDDAIAEVMAREYRARWAAAAPKGFRLTLPSGAEYEIGPSDEPAAHPFDPPKPAPPPKATGGISFDDLIPKSNPLINSAKSAATTALVPVLIAWPLIWGIVAVIRWIRAGFKQTAKI